MELSEEQECLVLENLRLVYFLIRTWGISPISSDYEDVVSVGTIGLIKATTTFDPSKNVAFVTYASRCIVNEIGKYFYKVNKYAKDISLNKLIEDTNLTLEDMIENPESNFVEGIINKEEYIKLLEIILNCLKGKYRNALLYRLGNVSQNEIIEKLRISRSYLTRINTKAFQQVRELANRGTDDYEKVFSVEIMEEEYKFSFPCKDISSFNKVFATILQNWTPVENLPDFEVDYNGEKITIQVPISNPDSFRLMAQIIQEIDTSDMLSVFGNTTQTSDKRKKLHTLAKTKQ